MKISSILLGIALAQCTQVALAYPGMKGLAAELRRRQDVDDVDDANDANEANDDGDLKGELIGDLNTTGPITPTGRSIANILTGSEPAQSHETYSQPISGSAACRADPCCIWSQISKMMTATFRGPSGRCNAIARAAIRLGFHDAGTWSKKLAAAGNDFGGADGSIALSGSEINRAENNGLQIIIGMILVWRRLYGVGAADLIQFAANHATVTCPLGPRTRTFIGRVDSKRAAPDGLLPGVNDSADQLISLFEDKTISPHALTALVGAHSTSQQFFVDKKKFGQPQDGTPGIWDTLFYNQTMYSQVPKGVFRLQSDLTLVADPRVADEWAKFASGGGQKHWNEDYASAYVRLSLLGVNNINNLTECTKVLPVARPQFATASQLYVDE